MTIRSVVLAGTCALVAACAAPQAPPVASTRPVPAVSPGRGSSTAAASPDPLGPKPEVASPESFALPVPVVYRTPGGITVWLLERHALPLVAIQLVLPSGSASDPAGREGLAYATANMLDEGAGRRGAIELSQAVEMLGATLGTAATPDGSFVSLSVLKRHLAEGFALLADVVARPRFEPREWARVHALWVNELKARASDPAAVRQVVARVVLYGTNHPYGHPVSGLVGAAERASLDEVRRFYRRAYRPDRATLVVVGDVTRDELAPLIEHGFAAWKPLDGPPPAPVVPPPPRGPWPRVVLVDRPDAPQAGATVTWPVVAASDPERPLLERVNAALGGSFTSRLNQELREERGWSYGASSRIALTRGMGQIAAGAAIHSDKLGVALQALMANVKRFRAGLTGEEVAKTRAQLRAEHVQTFERVETTAARFGQNASLGLAADFEAWASKTADAADKSALDRVAARHFDVAEAPIVIVGPKRALIPQLVAAGFPDADLRDAEGRPVAPHGR